ncbi:MAG: hypothetical protein AAF790_06990 [Planctomycetota bacterium]
MPDTICWLHDEMLRADCVPAGTPALFVFDQAWIEQERLSLKQIVFMYECLQAMPGVAIRRGDLVEEVRAFAAEHGATRVATQQSPLPRLKRQIALLGDAGLEVEAAEPEPIATLPDGVDLKRFNRYWRKAEKQVMRRV